MQAGILLEKISSKQWEREIGNFEEIKRKIYKCLQEESKWKKHYCISFSVNIQYRKKKDHKKIKIIELVNNYEITIHILHQELLDYLRTHVSYIRSQLSLYQFGSEYRKISSTSARFLFSDSTSPCLEK